MNPLTRNPDLALYYVHFASWGALGVTRLVLRTFKRDTPAASELAPVSGQERTAPFSRSLIAFHALAFGAMYFGMANAVLPNRVPTLFRGQRTVGTLVIAIGAALVALAFVHFQSWRFRAKLGAGHQLATDGPFRVLRHPIYMGLNLLALGTAVWAPTPIIWVGFVLMAIGSDLRARAEETLLETEFGSAYLSYRHRTWRFVPGIY